MDRHGVRELGLRSFFRLYTGVFFGGGVTSAYFQELGRRCSLKEAFRIVFTGKATQLADSLSSQFGRPSGPVAFAGLSLDSNL